jgi:P4 family phage/plasmid primase-like protien
VSTDLTALVAQTDLVRLVAGYVELKPRGREHVGLCPFHAEDNPSFVVGSHKGRDRFRCWSCGESGNAIDFLTKHLGVSIGEAAKLLNGGDLPPPNIAPRVLQKPKPRVTRKPPRGTPAPDCIRRDGTQPISMRPYLDSASELLGMAAFYADDPDPRYWTWGAAPGEVEKWEAKPFSAPRPFYGAQSLARMPKAQVIVVEDEPSADACETLFPGFAALAMPGGRNGVREADWKALKGRRVVLIPTGDDAGRDCMKVAAQALEGYAPECKGIEVDMIPLSGFIDSPDTQAPHGWTLADGLAAGWTPETALKWAQDNKINYRFTTSGPVAESRSTALPPAPAPVVPSVSTPPPVPEPVQDAQDAPRAADTPVAAPPVDNSAAPVPRQSSGILGVVEGNTVRAPRKPPEPEADLPVEFSEDALAESFSREFPDWRYTPASGSWYGWDGARWKPDDKESVFHVCRHHLRAECNRPDGGEITREGRKRIASFKMVHAVLGLVGRDPRHATAREEWDRDPWLLGTPAGVVDLRIGKLIEASREQLISKCTGVAPVEGPTPLMDRVMRHATQGDADLEAYLWRFLGYCLTGSVREEKFLFIVGQEGTGKSTLIQVIQEILSDYAVSCKPGFFRATKHEQHDQEIARLVGARFAYASETEEGSRFAESKLKWVTGGDKLTAHFMRENSFEFKPTFKVCIYGNNRPGLSSNEGIRRRMCLVEWPALAPEDRDAAVKAEIHREYPAILARMLRACVEWQQSGLGEPEQVRSATEDYLRGEDAIGAWCEDCITVGVDYSALSGEAYKSYRAWCESEGEHFTLSHKRFSQRLRERGYVLKKTFGGRIFEGFRLNASPAIGP